ncbi:MAG TPA: histidine phosphatase family protein [Candidatus Binataceae bacterium]|nr:histidine phosphatase family protein [Candidatus Binataceae bacterium]
MIYLTLHGETEWNRQRRFQGQLDSPLTEHGVQQARLMGTTLRVLLGDSTGCTIVSSPLGRAHRTAEIICEVLGIAPKQIETDARLAEINLGSWAGCTRDEVKARWPGALDDTGRYDWYFRSPDGESLDDVTTRVRQWLSDTAARDRRIAVSHGVTSRILRGIYGGIAKPVALTLEVSRDVVFRLHDGSIDRIPCE